MSTFEVLSPWAEVDWSEIRGLSPRLEDLEGKTIGMFGDFMINSEYMLKEVEKELSRRYKNLKFSHIRYLVELPELSQNKEFLPEFHTWLEGVDTVISFYGSVPSSALFQGYNTAYIEKLGKPCVMLTTERTFGNGVRGVTTKKVPDMRIYKYDIQVDRVRGHVTQELVSEALKDDLSMITDWMVEGLTKPLNKQEADPAVLEQSLATGTYTGTSEEINRIFYKNGWSNGISDTDAHKRSR